MTVSPEIVFKTTINERPPPGAPSGGNAGAKAGKQGYGRMGLRVISAGDDKAGSSRKPDPSTYATVYPSALEGVTEAARNAPATAGMVLETLDAAVAVALDGHGELKAQLAQRETEIVRLQASLAEVRSKVAELAFVSERLQIESRGPPGIQGLRGRDGRDAVGIAGPRGERGETGPPAPTIAAWEVRPERFEIVPRYSTGEAGPPIALLALFQAYDAAVQELDDRDLTEAAQASRAETERQAEAFRQGQSR